MATISWSKSISPHLYPYCLIKKLSFFNLYGLHGFNINP